MAGPGRGRWDRGQTRDARLEAQRLRLMRAAARASAEHGLLTTVTHVVEGAGVGRNTFYEHFADVQSVVDAARSAALDELLAKLRGATSDARTPLSRLRAFSRAWLEAVVEHRWPAASVLEGGAGRRYRAELVGALDDELWAVLVASRDAGALSLPPEPLRARCVGGAYEAAARLVLGDASVDAERLAETLVDLAVRSFR